MLYSWQMLQTNIWILLTLSYTWYMYVLNILADDNWLEQDVGRLLTKPAECFRGFELMAEVVDLVA